MASSLDGLPELAHFLETEPVAAVALPIDNEGTIHAAMLTCWCDLDTLRLYFVTGKNTEKCRLLLQRESVRAASVVGTYRGTAFTVQMRGAMRIADKESHADAIEKYYAKRGNHHDDIINPDNVLLEFTPDWIRYTDYSQGYAHHFLKGGEDGRA